MELSFICANARARVFVGSVLLAHCGATRFSERDCWLAAVSRFAALVSDSGLWCAHSRTQSCVCYAAGVRVFVCAAAVCSTATRRRERACIYKYNRECRSWAHAFGRHSWGMHYRCTRSVTGEVVNNLLYIRTLFARAKSSKADLARIDNTSATNTFAGNTFALDK